MGQITNNEDVVMTCDAQVWLYHYTAAAIQLGTGRGRQRFAQRRGFDPSRLPE
jgi:hypothetical protein